VAFIRIRRGTRERLLMIKDTQQKHGVRKAWPMATAAGIGRDKTSGGITPGPCNLKETVETARERRGRIAMRTSGIKKQQRTCKEYGKSGEGKS